MDREELIEILYENHVRADISIEDLADEIIRDVRHGKWLYDKYTWKCSECGNNPTKGMGYVQGHDELFPFCPNCGAKMDE